MSDTMRQCDGAGCGNPAVVHLTQVVDNKSTTQYLCKACAAAKGIGADPDPMDLAKLLQQLEERNDDLPASGPGPICMCCGLTFEKFRERARLGCADCINAFDPALRRLLERLHGATRHAGKVYLPPDPAAAEMNRHLDGLRRSLERAVKTEDFERAARLRDRIRAHEAERGLGGRDRAGEGPDPGEPVTAAADG